MKQAATDRDWAREAIRTAGLRVTPARVATLLALRHSSAPQTHAEVAARLAEDGVDQATVFRNLNDMATAGLLRRSELGDRVWRFEIVSDDEHASHPHFVCVDCGTVSCMEDVELTRRSKAASQRLGEVTEIVFRGHCYDCP